MSSDSLGARSDLTSFSASSKASLAGGGDQLIGLFFSEIGAGDALAEDDGVLGVGESGAGFVELDRGRDTGSYQGLDTLNLHARTENVGIFLG